MNIDGSNQKRLTHNNVDDYGPSWSPDGTKVAFIALGKPQYSGIGTFIPFDIFVRTDKTQQNITSNNDWESDPSWSPDGRKIVFSARGVINNDEIWVLTLDGTAHTTLLTRNSASDRDPSWSPFIR